jgi:hypothetical protein
MAQFGSESATSVNITIVLYRLSSNIGAVIIGFLMMVNFISNPSSCHLTIS